MNETKYNEVKNGIGTYRTIAKTLLSGFDTLVGWTDCRGTHLDVYFSLNNTIQYGCEQRGINVDYLLVGVVGIGFFGFQVSGKKFTKYVSEKLNMDDDETTEALTELINGVIKILIKEKK